MINERYNISGLSEICFHLEKFRDKTDEDWQIDFYNAYDILLFSIENDEDTMEALKDHEETYKMVSEFMDIALMMGNEI